MRLEDPDVAIKYTEIKIGDRVEWPWGNAMAEGVVKDIFTQPTFVSIGGERIGVEASPIAPLYFIRQSDGMELLKTRLELHPQHRTPFSDLIAW